MNFQVFGETVCLSAFSCILASIGSVVSFYKRCVDCITDRRSHQECGQEGDGSENQLADHMHDTALLASFPHRCIANILGNHDHGFGGSSWPGLLWLGLLFAINLLDSAFIRSMLITGKKKVCLSSSSFLNLLDYLFTVLGRPWPRNDREQKTTFRVDCGMVPNIALAFIRRIVWINRLLFLSDERPLFVELNFFGLRGKKKPARRGRFGHAPRSFVRIGSPCPCSLSGDDLLPEFHNLLEGGPTRKEQLPPKDATPKEEFLASRRSSIHRSSNEAFESSSRTRSSQKTANFLVSEGQIAYSPCFGNKRLLWYAGRSPWFSSP